MRRIISICICLNIVFSITLALSMNSYAANRTGTSKSSKINGVTIFSNTSVDVDAIKSHGFNTVFLIADKIRNIKKPYNTNYHSLRMLQSNVLKLEKANLNYIICFESGPGYSDDGKTLTLFKNKFEMNYFSQMVKEIVKRYYSHGNFIAASINILSPDIAENKFYETQNYIIDTVRKSYSDLKIMYNLDPLSFEEGIKDLPETKPVESNLILNLGITLRGLSYPGYGAGFKTSIKLNKNSVLQTLEKFKDFQSKLDAPSIITLKTPWVDNSEVLLQDLFEIYKMLDLDNNLCYANSSDMYDITQNKSVVKVLDRHNQ